MAYSPARKLFSPVVAAAITALAIKRSEEKRGRRFNRVKISIVTIKKLTGREKLFKSFLEDYKEWLIEYGWNLINDGESYGLVRSDSINGFPPVTSRHVRDEINKLREDEIDLAELDEELGFTKEEGEDEADEDEE